MSNKSVFPESRLILPEKVGVLCNLKNEYEIKVFTNALPDGVSTRRFCATATRTAPTAPMRMRRPPAPAVTIFSTTKKKTVILMCSYKSVLLNIIS